MRSDPTDEHSGRNIYVCMVTGTKKSVILTCSRNPSFVSVYNPGKLLSYFEKVIKTPEIVCVLKFHTFIYLNLNCTR